VQISGINRNGNWGASAFFHSLPITFTPECCELSNGVWAEPKLKSNWVHYDDLIWSKGNSFSFFWVPNV